MKRYVVLVFCVAFACIAAVGCAREEQGNTGSEVSTNVGDNAKGADEGDKESGRTKLVVGFDANFPPYGFMEGEEYVGFDLDLAAEVAKRQGWQLEKQPIDWDSKDMELETGTIDCIWNGFTKSEERMDKYAWTDAYVDNSQVFVVSSDSGIKTKADLADKVVVVQADSSALEAINNKENADLKASFSNLDEVADYNAAFMNLEAGTCDAVAMDIGVAKYQIESRGDEYVILDELLAKEQYAVGFKLGNESLRDVVQKTLKEMVTDGTFGKIAEQWELADSVCLTP